MSSRPREWTDEEQVILVENYRKLGPRATLAKLWADGWSDRTYRAVTHRADLLGLPIPERRARGPQSPTPAPTPISDLPSRPAAVSRALFELAESADRRPLTLAEYERRKAEILGESR